MLALNLGSIPGPRCQVLNSRLPIRGGSRVSAHVVAGNERHRLCASAWMGSDPLASARSIQLSTDGEYGRKSCSFSRRSASIPFHNALTASGARRNRKRHRRALVVRSKLDAERSRRDDSLMVQPRHPVGPPGIRTRRQRRTPKGRQHARVQ